MHTPPGISLLVTAIFKSSVLPLALGLLDYLVLRPRQVHTLPTWFTVTTYLLSPLAAFSIPLLLGDLIIYVRAKRAGAVLPPHNPTWVPGAIHRVIGTLKAEDTTYIGNMLTNKKYMYSPPVQGAPLEDLSKKFGNTFNLRVLFINRVSFPDVGRQKGLRP